MNKSIEILKQDDHNELDKYLKTEIEATPKFK